MQALDQYDFVSGTLLVSRNGRLTSVQQPVAQATGQRPITVTDRIAKIMEVVDLRPFNRHGMGLLNMIEQSAVHGVGVDYQIITGSIE
ncbi:hypothetical protein D3C79_663120 [compost metagenome]